MWGDYVTTDDGLKGEVSSVSVLRQMVKYSWKWMTKRKSVITLWIS